MNQSRSHSSNRAFTLVEMIGVLAIIAVLAVVIAPKVFGAIRSSRINATLLSVETFATATTEFVGKYGTLPTTNANGRIDDLLRTTGYVDDRFSSKIGLQADIYAKEGANWTRNNTGTWVQAGGVNQSANSRIICLVSNTTDPSAANGANYQLDGTTNLPTGARVVSAVLESVPIAEAREFSERIDGDAMSSADNAADADGKVVYRAPSGAGLTDVYIYMLHQ